MTLIDYALQYVARGWYVFPLRPRGKLPIIASKDGGRGFHDATIDPKQIEAWWTKWPEANIGIATGASGLVVLDVDGPEGQTELAALVQRYGPLPRTLAQQTGRAGGLHLFYRGNGIRSSQVKGEHLDVRGNSGYVVAPPSVHPSGTLYQWVDAGAPLADAAGWWLGEWVANRKGPVAPQAAPPGPRQGASAPPATGRGLAARSVANLTETPQFTLLEANRLRSALAVIDAAIDGGTWFSYGAALHDLKWIVNGRDYGFEIWLEWSSTSKGRGEGLGLFRGRADLEKRWASFSREYNGVRATVASIYKRAFELGWQYNPGQASGDSDSHSEGLNGFSHNFGNQAGFIPPILWPDHDQWGRPKPTCRNARAAIRHMGLTCEYDTFHEKLIIGGQPIAAWAGELTDNAVHMLRVTIERTYKMDPGTTSTFDAAIQECLQGAFDPVADYLDDLQWDGVPRLRSWLATYLGAADTPLNAAMGGLMLIAAVRRVRVPGCKFDQILVLISDEGKNKSSAIELLAGTDNFSDQTILTLSDKEQQEAIGGVWLYEIADLAGMSKADTEKVKAFASRRVDRARPAYGRARQDKPRRCVFIATTNHSTFLKSQTGNRRFWPVEVGRIDLAAIARDRDQLWAEAAAIEKRNAPLFLPEAMWNEARLLQDQRQDHDPWEDILTHVEGKKESREKLPYTSPDGRFFEARILSRNLLQVSLGLPAERWTDVTAKRVAFIMRRLGWDGPKLMREGDEHGKGFTKQLGPVTEVSGVPE